MSENILRRDYIIFSYIIKEVSFKNALSKIIQNTLGLLLYSKRKKKKKDQNNKTVSQYSR